MLRADDPVTFPDVLPNLRDLGGLPTEAGGRTREGVLLRSAAPHEGDRTPTDVAHWPPVEVVDLRSRAELRGRPHPLERPGTRVHAWSMLDGWTGGRPGNWAAIPDLPVAYPEFLTAGTATLVRVLRLVAHAQGPVLVHCAAGKDRTGIAVAVLLRAAGVATDAVVADYLRTAEHIDDVFARGLAAHGPEDPTHRQRLMGSPPEAIAGVLELLDAARADSPDPAGAWLLAQGADPADLAAWRARIVG